MADKPEDKAPKARRPAKAGTTRKRASAKTEAIPVSADAPEPKRRKAAAAPAEKAQAAPKPAPALKRKSASHAKAEAVAPAKAKPAKPRARKAVAAKPAPLLPAAPPQDEVPTADVTIHPVEAHAPGVQPHDEGLEFGLSPVDLPDDPRVQEDKGFGWFTRIMLVTSALLVLFNSFAIDKWAREQPVTQWNSQVLIAAQQLHAGMKGMHLDAPLEGMRTAWHAVRDARWPGSDNAKPRSDEGLGK